MELRKITGGVIYVSPPYNVEIRVGKAVRGRSGMTFLSEISFSDEDKIFKFGGSDLAGARQKAEELASETGWQIVYHVNWQNLAPAEL